MLLRLEINNEIKNEFFSLLKLLDEKVKVLNEIETVKKSDLDYQIFLDRKGEEEISFEEVKSLL